MAPNGSETTMLQWAQMLPSTGKGKDTIVHSDFKETMCNSSSFPKTPLVTNIKNQDETSDSSSIQSILSTMPAQEQLNSELPLREETTKKASKKDKCPNKCVKWCPQLVSSECPGVISGVRHTLMSTTNLPSSFMSSSIVEAVRYMIPPHVTHSEDIIELGVRFHLAVENSLPPNATSLLSTLIDCDFQEKDICMKFQNSNKGNNIEESSNIEQCNISENDEDKLDIAAKVDSPIINEVRDSIQIAAPLTDKQRIPSLVQVLKREQELLQKQSKCVSCAVKPKEVTFLPCGHFCLCVDCADQTSICPLCQTKALAEVRTFIG